MHDCKITVNHFHMVFKYFDFIIRSQDISFDGSLAPPSQSCAGSSNPDHTDQTPGSVILRRRIESKFNSASQSLQISFHYSIYNEARDTLKYTINIVKHVRKVRADEASTTPHSTPALFTSMPTPLHVCVIACLSKQSCIPPVTCVIIFAILSDTSESNKSTNDQTPNKVSNVELDASSELYLFCLKSHDVQRHHHRRRWWNQMRVTSNKTSKKHLIN